MSASMPRRLPGMRRLHRLGYKAQADADETAAIQVQ